MQTKYFILLLIILLLPLSVTFAQPPVDCAVGLTPQLVLTEGGTVIAEDKLALHFQPGFGSGTIADVEPGTEFETWFGPACTDAVWWFVIVDETMGWITESTAESDEYLLESTGESAQDLPTRPRAGDDPLEFDELGLQFSLSANIAGTANVGWVLANEDQNNPGNFAYPLHREVTFEGYIGSEKEFWLYMRVHPAEEWEVYTEISLDDLRTLLDEQPDDLFLTGLPFFGAARVIDTQREYINFQNGTGVRSLVYYSQSYAPVTDGRLVYLFSGMTDDRNYLVHIAFALDSVMLPDDTTLNENFNYDAYLAYSPDLFRDNMRQMISLAPDGMFRPRPSDIDQLIESLYVGEPELCGELPSLVSVGDTVRQALDNDPLRVRDGANGTMIESFLPGEEAVVINGPECIDGIVWWQIFRENDWNGWVAEAVGDTYFIEPIDQ